MVRAPRDNHSYHDVNSTVAMVANNPQRSGSSGADLWSGHQQQDESAVNVSEWSEDRAVAVTDGKDMTEEDNLEEACGGYLSQDTAMPQYVSTAFTFCMASASAGLQILSIYLSSV